jgi:hypothetical protein
MDKFKNRLLTIKSRQKKKRRQPRGGVTASWGDEKFLY